MSDVLATLVPADFRSYFTRDFKYLPAYSASKVYFKDDIVALTTSGVTNFYKMLLTTATGISPTDVTDPPTWEAVNISTDDYVLDSDITKAYRQAIKFVNPCLFEDDDVLTDAYLYCSAHYLVMDIRMAETGLDNRSEGVVASKGVGSVNVSFKLPVEDPQWEYFNTTEYGKKYLSYVRPRVQGHIGVARGDTQA